MRGVELSILALVLVVMLTITAISIIGPVLSVFGATTPGATADSVKTSACYVLQAAGCENPSSVRIDFDADMNGVIDNNDDLQDLCDNYYNAGGSVAECKKQCRCIPSYQGTTSDNGGGTEPPDEEPPDEEITFGSCEEACQSNDFISGDCVAEGTLENTKLYVDGTVIKSPSGNPIRLQGFNVEPRDIDEEGVQWLKDNGFNYLRVNIFWHRFEPTEDVWDNTYVTYLDNLLEWCEENNIYVNLALMQWQWSPYFKYYSSGGGTGFPSWLISEGNYEDSAIGLRDCIADFYMERNSHGIKMRQEFYEFWDFIINRYMDNPYVAAYEVINEPLIAKQVYHVSGVNAAVMDLYEEFTERYRSIDTVTIHVYHDCGGERKVTYPNIAWTKSWYDVMWGGYSSGEYIQIGPKITALKNKYNIAMGTPFIISEMGFTESDEASNGAEAWIEDSFDVMREIGLNNGYESYGWFIYNKGTKYGFRTPRNSDGSNTWIIPVLKNYIEASSGISPFYVGLSSIPRQQGSQSPYAISSVDEVISVTKLENLNVWRMSFPPTFSDWKTYIQHFLDNSDADLIVDYYHLDPGSMSDSQWSASTARGLEIAEEFDNYQDRLWLEPCNEQMNTDIDDKAQDFVDAIREAGYRNKIVVNIFWQSGRLPMMSSVDDPLDKFWTGQHIYFYDTGSQVWSMSNAQSWMQEGLDAGLKILNTELGADTEGQSYFTNSAVDRVNDFMAWCADREISNVVWTMYGDYDYPRYKELGLEFPSVETPIMSSGSCPPENIVDFDCPSGVCCCSGTPVCPAEPDYPTDEWDRVWCDIDFTEKIADSPEETSLEFDNNWGINQLISGYNDYIGFRSGRSIYFQGGTYEFIVGADDGIRVWIDGKIKVDEWVRTSYKTYTFTETLAQGYHDVRIDYYEDWINAQVSFSYEKIDSGSCVDECIDQGFSSGECVAEGSVQFTKLHTEGKYVKNEAGQIIHLVGANVYAAEWYLGNIDAQQFQYMKEWGFNSIRITIPSWTIIYNHWQDASFRQKYLDMIQFAKDNEMYVVVSVMHLDDEDTDERFNLFTNTWSTADWTYYIQHVKDIVTLTKDEDHVIYDLLNEPLYLESWEFYMGIMEDAVDAVREADSGHDAICIVEAGSRGYFGESRMGLHFFDDYPNGIDKNNIIYSDHIYQDDDWAATSVYSEADIRSRFVTRGVYKPLNVNKPVWIGEFNTEKDFVGHTTLKGEEFLTSVMDIARKDDFAGWCVWAWGPIGRHEVIDDYVGTPSASGEVIKKYLEVSAPPTPDGVLWGVNLGAPRAYTEYPFFSQPETRQLYKDAGIKVIRLFNTWSFMNNAESVVDEIESIGAKPIIVVAESRLLEFVRRLGTRAIYQIGNEPNYDQENYPTAQSYADYYKEWADQAVAINPDIKLMTAGIGVWADLGNIKNYPERGVDYLTKTVATGAQVDYVAFHYYASGTASGDTFTQSDIYERAARVSEAIQIIGDATNKPVAVTEWNFGDWEAPRWDLDEAFITEYTRITMEGMKDTAISIPWFAQHWDDPTNNHPLPMLYADGAPKPLYYKFKEIATKSPSGGASTTSCPPENIVDADCSPGVCCCSGTPICPEEPTYPTDSWNRVWCDMDFTEKLTETSEPSIQFNNDWGTSQLIAGYDDYIGFMSGRTINFPENGTYTFKIGSDDGVRVWIDGTIRFENWTKRSYNEDTFTTYLDAGNHRFRIDYFEDWIDAKVSFKYMINDEPSVTDTCGSACSDRDYSTGTCRSETSGGTLTPNELANSPDKWKFIAGHGGAGSVNTFMPEDIAQHVMGLGANGIYIGVYTDNWGNPKAIQRNGLTQTDHRLRYANEIHRLSGLVYMQNYPYSFELDTNWTKHVIKQTEVIYNTNGMQDTYIEWSKRAVVGGYWQDDTYVEGLNPDVIQIMNEVKGDQETSYASAEFWDNYIAFCNRFMAEISKVKSNAVFTVSSVPFWDLKEIAKHAHRFIVPSGSKLYFSFHYYYALWNSVPSSWEAGNVAYWNNGNPLTQAQRENVKNTAYNVYLTRSGVKSLLDIGKTVIWDEVGTHIDNPNIEAFIQDVKEFSDTYGVGTSWLDNTANDNEAWNHMPGQLWDSGTWNLNRLGEIWYQTISSGSTTSPTTTQTCLSGETPIDQDGCSSGTCCCSEVLTQSEDCIDYVNNGPANQRLDILFIPDGYTDLSLLQDDVATVSENLLSTEPFSSYADKINIRWMNIKASYGCDVENCYIGGLSICANNDYENLLLECPADKVIVIINQERTGACAGGRDVWVSRSNQPGVFVHELGHSFGSLADEYVYSSLKDTAGPSPTNKINCDNLPCSQWSDVPETDCIEGCTYGKDWYRPVETCMMRSSNVEFCPVCENHLIELLSKYP